MLPMKRSAAWRKGRARRDGPSDSRRGVSAPSFDQRLVATGGHPSGFDYLRMGLALSVIFFHSLEFCRPTISLPFLFRAPFSVWNYSIVPMFFCLSGFLVAGSLERTRSLLGFAGLRVLRIFPALAVDTVFSAIVLGLTLTTLPWRTYLAAPEFRSYFLNMAGDIHYFLPGVFRGNPYPAVNTQLWTIPYELYAYAALTGLAALGLARRRGLFLLTALLATVLFPALSRLAGPIQPRHVLVVPCFLLGVAAYLYRSRIAWRLQLFAVAVLGMILAVSVPHGLAFLPIPLTYATVFLGLSNPGKIFILRTGDYSYGMYLYGFPIGQALIATTPLAGVWYINFLLAVVVAGGFAALSWHLVEKPCLALKPRLFRLETEVLTKLRPTTAREG